MRHGYAAIAACLILTAISGCGGGSSSGGGGGQQSGGGGGAISVSISPSNPSAVSAGGTQTFTATVTNDSTNAGVTWGASFGSITSAGVYSPPGVISQASATIIATSKADATKSASVTLPLVENSANGITVGPIGPASVNLGVGGSQVFSDTVTGDGTNAGVTWSIGSGPGTLSGATAGATSTVTYNAPATPISSSTTVTLTATSKTATNLSTTATITLNPISVSVTPASGSMNGGATQNITATVANDGTNAGVNWTATLGSFNPTSTLSGVATVYTAPNPSSATTVTVTATSKADPTKSSSTTINVAPVISLNPISPNAATLAIGGSQGFTDTVVNDSTNSGVSWSITSGPGTLSGATTTGVTYNAPTTAIQSATTAVLTATSVHDPTKSVSVSINLVPISVALTSPSTVTLDGDGVSTTTIGATVTNDGTAAGATFNVSGAGGTMNHSTVSGNSPSAVYTAPTLSAASSSTVTVASVKDPTKTQVVTITLNPAMQFTTAPGALPGGADSVAYPTTTLGVSGGTGSKTFSISSGSLPSGLTLSSAGVITGTPTGSAGTSTFTVQVTDQASTQGVLSGTFTITIGAPLAVTTTSGSLAAAVQNSPYSQTLAASGGTGTGYTWTVTAGATGSNSLATLNLSISSSGAITGTPTTTGTANFTVQVTDSASNTATATLSISTGTVLALPVPNPASLGTAGINLAYSGSIYATGGIAGYTWTVNGTPVPTNGTSVALTDGISVTNNGSATLQLSGTPTATGTVSFTATVRDSTGATAGPVTYGLGVSNTYSVGGGFYLPPCSPSPFSFSGVTVSISTSPVQTTTINPNGSFSFANVPNGTYTLTPSDPNAVFSPATETVTVSGGNLSAVSFTATLGYSVTGTVSYSGTQTGRIYLALIPGKNCYVGSTGASISAPGAFTIHGVPPGTYTLEAFLDNGAGGYGVPNAGNPTGSTSAVTVATSDITGVSVSLADPSPVVLSTSPTLTNVSGLNNAAVVEYTPITNGSGVETATYYTLQWSTASDFSTIAGSKSFAANGTHNNFWLLHNNLTNGNAYYFRAYGTSGGTAQGPNSPIVGPVTIGAPTAGDTVTGTVSFAATPTGPMYTGFLDQGTGAFYGQYFASPSNAQPYSINVPPGSDYLFLGIVDQNQDGLVDAGDVTNTGNGSSQPIVVVSGPISSNNLTLPSTNGIATVTTEAIQSITSLGTTQSYTLLFNINGLVKRPVSVTLVSGPNLIAPVDIAICGGSGSNCSQGYEFSVNLNSTSPNVGDTYTFDVTYSDGTTDVLSAAVSAVSNAYATGLSPQTGLSVSQTPTFSWTDPVNPGDYAYQFLLTDPNGNTIWQVPGSSVGSKGFSSAITSITWGTDPTGGGSTPTVGSLTLDSLYTWQIDAQDSNGNEAITQVQYQP